MKYLKNNRWILGLIVILILITGFLVQDFRNSKKKSNMSKQEVAGAEDCKKTISQDDAVQIVKNLPEVQQFLNKVGWNNPAPGVTSEPTVDFDAEVGNYYSIHVYELVSDKNYNDSHTATFNWYKVDKCTGEIRCSFSIYAKDSDGSYKYLRETDDKECNGTL